MSELTEKAIAQVTFEIEQIDQLLAVYADLLERVQQRTPDLVEVAAIASVLHSFYNGLENIFLSIAKGLDQADCCYGLKPNAAGYACRTSATRRTLYERLCHKRR